MTCLDEESLEIIMLRWASHNTLKARRRNEYVHKKLEIAPIDDKIKEKIKMGYVWRHISCLIKQTYISIEMRTKGMVKEQYLVNL